MRATVTGIGVYYPESVLTNADIAKLVDTSDDWITTRTGIKERHILPKDSSFKSSDLGAEAARRALEQAGLEAADIDGIIVGAINPDKQFPATACFIQQKIGAHKAFAYDVTAACAGFVFALNQGALAIQSGQCKNVLIIGAELLSPVVDWSDRNTCILFGDAAGAVVLSETEDPGRGVLRSVLQSDGRQSEILFLDNGVGASKRAMRMDGKQVFKHAVTSLTDVVRRSLELEGLGLEQLDLLVPHQANIRILNAVAERLGLPREKIVINVQKFGNTSAASVPLALFEAQQAGLLQPGKLVALTAIGGGLSWGCNLIRW